MTDHSNPSSSPQELSVLDAKWSGLRLVPFVTQWGTVVVLLYLLLAAISLLSIGAQSTLGQQARSLFTIATHPILGLCVGMVATAILQSSSVVTSIIVGLVAGGLPVAIAIPMVMGANIGTTVTNTLVSLGHIRQSDEFRRAFAAATVHDAFNVLNVAILFPLELSFGILSHIGQIGAQFLARQGGVSFGSVNLIKVAIAPLVNGVEIAMGQLPPPFDSVGLIGVGVVMIGSTLFRLSRLLNTLVVGAVKERLLDLLGRGSFVGIASGTLVTALVQSSSTTTSLMVPLAGAGIVSLREVYPFMLGANIGTCITALLAAMAVPEGATLPALQIALVHFAFNGLGVLLLYGVPILRPLPIWMAETLANLVVKHRMMAIAYIIGVFIALPACFLSLTLLPQ